MQYIYNEVLIYFLRKSEMKMVLYELLLSIAVGNSLKLTMGCGSVVSFSVEYVAVTGS